MNRSAERIGYAIVGLGELTVTQLLPAFRKTRFSRAVALVSADRPRALAIAREHGIAEHAVYDYAGFDRLADNDEVQAVFIVLPNSLHAEFTLRAARCGKHVLCEKPMASSVADCELMIGACAEAGLKLMIGYRCQYEPMNRYLAEQVRHGRLGALRDFSAYNGQVLRDPGQWRLKRELAGGGPLADIGIYCLNAARFISGEEPYEVIGSTYATPDDPRFQEVEESAQFILRFPSGLVAHCGSGYSTQTSRLMRLSGSEAWAELNPAFGYDGLRLRFGHQEDGRDVVVEPAIPAADPFANEIDHLSRCILDDIEPHTPGEEGLQDMRIIDAIYASARSGTTVALNQPGRTRGPLPTL